MPLNNTTLGQALHNARSMFNDKDINEILMMFGSMDNARLEISKAEAGAINDHIKTEGLVLALGLVAPNGPVTGTAKIT